MDSRFFYGASLFTKLVNDMDAYCLDAHNNWSFYNRSELMYSENLTSKCSKIHEVCCHEIELSSVNSDVKNRKNISFYGDEPKDSLGIYKAIGMNNGRYVYQQKNLDRFLEYGDRYWLVSTGIGMYSGHIHHPGGSVCPEHIKNEWQIAEQRKNGQWTWKSDPELKITCVKKSNDIHIKHDSEETGPIAQPYIQIEHVGQTNSSCSGAVAFGCISMLLLIVMIAFFARRFKRAWGRGAHGKQLLFETMDFE